MYRLLLQSIVNPLGAPDARPGFRPKELAQHLRQVALLYQFEGVGVGSSRRAQIYWLPDSRLRTQHHTRRTETLLCSVSGDPDPADPGCTQNTTKSTEEGNHKKWWCNVYV